MRKLLFLQEVPVQQTGRGYGQRFVWSASEVKYSPLIRKNPMLDCRYTGGLVADVRC